MCEMASTSTTIASDGKWQVEANQGGAEERYGEDGEREGRRGEGPIKMEAKGGRGPPEVKKARRGWRWRWRTWLRIRGMRVLRRRGR